MLPRLFAIYAPMRCYDLNYKRMYRAKVSNPYVNWLKTRHDVLSIKIDWILWRSKKNIWENHMFIEACESGLVME